MKTLIESKGLVKRYGNRTVVNGVDVTVGSDEVLGIIGPNGAGKSTTLEMILGLRRPDGGSVSYWCNDPRKRMGVQLQSIPFFPKMNALENLRMFAAFYGVRLSKEDISDLLEHCGLKSVSRTDAVRLSGGQQKRLAIAMTLVHQPQIIFLDEPTAALDPRARHEIRELIRGLTNAGTSVVFTSHDMEEVAKLADRVILIFEGKVKASGTPEQLLKRYEVKHLDELYLNLTV